jgi:cyclic pyranopterin phosphate synthase
MPKTGPEFKPRTHLLRYDQIAAITGVAGWLGIVKTRLTGGEPLVAGTVADCVRSIAQSSYFEEICMTTNGSLLTRKLAHALKAAGLNRVNISLDTLDPTRFARITRGGNIGNVLAGIDAAILAGLSPVKINMVVFDNTTDEEIRRMRLFCDQRGLTLQTIARFWLAGSALDRHRFTNVHRPPDCAVCNRLRLTADGYLKSCLFSDKEVKIDFNDIEGSFRDAVSVKPEHGQSCLSRSMNQIGG